MRIQNFFLSFKSKLTLLVIAAISLPLLVAAVIGRQVLQERIYSSFARELTAGLESLDLIFGWLEQDLITEIARIASDDVIEDQLDKGTIPELKKLLTSQRRVVDLALLAAFNLEHELLASSKFKSKNLVIDFNQLEKFQVVQSGEEQYLIYVLPITKKTRRLGYIAAGVLLSDESFLSYLQSKHIANIVFWLDGKLLLTDLTEPRALSRSQVPLGQMFDARFSGLSYKGIMQFKNFDKHRLEYALFIPTTRVEEAQRALTITLVVSVSLLFILCVSLLEFLLNRMIKPLDHLTAYARQLSANKFTAHVDFALAKLAGSSHDEVGKLAEAFMHMERQLRAYLHELTETTRANERIQSELRIARDIQMSMLPHNGKALHNRQAFEIAAALEPAREVGGDFYDYFMVDENHLGFVIGDVSGKGVPASLFMAVSKALVRAVTSMARIWSSHGLLPEEVLMRVNQELCRENEMLMFVTLFYGMLDTHTGIIIYSSAGHNPPFLLSPQQGGVTPLQLLPSVPLGIKSSAQYRAGTHALQEQESLFLYTDGITEARDAAGELYSEARLENFLRQTKYAGAHELVKQTLAEIKNFAAEAPAGDDITVLVLKYVPPKTTVMNIHNHLADLHGLLPRLEEFGTRHHIAKEDLLSARLVVEELVTNTLKYGYNDKAKHDITIQLTLHENVLVIRIEDDAQAFDPLAAEPRSRNDQTVGGYGLQLVRELMNAWQYHRENGKNVLITKKNCRIIKPNDGFVL